MIHGIGQINNRYNSGNLLSLRPVSLNCLAFRYCIPPILLALSGGASAVGLGELRGQPNLGEPIRLEIVILGVEKQTLDSTCFRLVLPENGNDLPWLKKAELSVRKGSPQILEIRSNAILREPIMQLAVQVGCGHEISREYMLLASPEKNVSAPLADQRPVRAESPSRLSRRDQRPIQPDSAMPDVLEPPPRLTPRPAERRPAPKRSPDRVMLSNGGDVGEPSLRLATEISPVGGDEAKAVRREILRLEFRMLIALNEQATSQLETAEKLRSMEGALGELQQHASEFAQRIEKGGASVQPAVVAGSAAPLPSVSPDDSAKLSAPVDAKISEGLSEWSLYGVLLGALLGLGAWLGWKNIHERRQRLVESEPVLLVPENENAATPGAASELDDPGSVDLHFEPHASGPIQVDLELDGGEPIIARSSAMPSGTPFIASDSEMSVAATTVDEHFEANPVMELADIMLSFGRVKGAAQALQEFIDNNPQEALQPWIRLMDVYRMAGMRDEFEKVASNLNQHFNVEVQHWDPATVARDTQGADDSATLPVAPHPESLEDMPRLMSIVCELWAAGDVVGYLYQLLRDNRGGKRLGFALPVVEEILFLIELKETSNRIQ